MCDISIVNLPKTLTGHIIPDLSIASLFGIQVLTEAGCGITFKGACIVKYNGNTFTQYTNEDGLCDNSISGLFIDSNGIFWIRTWGGICQFDGEKFTDFALPYSSVETPINEDTKNWITEIKEDSKGNIWFARDGFGVCKYDGKSFTHFLKKDVSH